MQLSTAIVNLQALSLLLMHYGAIILWQFSVLENQGFVLKYIHVERVLLS